MTYKGYEAVIGLEIHVELKTKEKAFCSCSAEYGGEPNSKCCNVCLGKDGAKPKLNEKAQELIVKAGYALGCDISPVSLFDRKHYSYPDLPKGYQITQYYEPICKNGKLKYLLDGEEKFVRIERIHLEEDAGKITYTDSGMFVDFNRCGVPLAEIVTYPDLYSAEETEAFVSELRRTLLFAGVSDCKMNEGSLRCDVNISVRPVGSEKLGTRCEIKNLNSIHFIGKAVEYELQRQTDLILSGTEVSVETRRFSEDKGITEFMRPKESAEDYGYIRDFDLDPVYTDKDYVARVAKTLGKSPLELQQNMIKLQVNQADAELIYSETAYAKYFDSIINNTSHLQKCVNFFISEIIPRIKGSLPYALAEDLISTADMFASGEVNIVSARKILTICAEEKLSARKTAEKYGLFMINDREVIKNFVLAAAEAKSETVRDVLKGKTSAKKVIVGEVMKLSAGKVSPSAVNEEVDLYFEKLIQI